MCDKKNSVLFTDTKCLVLSHEFKLPDENQVLLRVLREINMYNVNLKNIVSSGDLTCNQSNPSAGFQDKFDAEKAREESDKQYVIFPVWSSGSTNPQNTNGDAAFDENEPKFDEKKTESKVNVSSSSSAQSKKHDNKTKKKAKGKSPVESLTGYKNLSAEFEDFSEDSINEVNAAGTLVPAVGQLSPNSTNTFSAAGPSNATTSPTHGKSSCIDTSQLPDDPDMLELEDIANFDDEDDIDVEADFNILETSITLICRMEKELLVPNGFLEIKRMKEALWSGTKLDFAQGHTQEEGIDYEEVFALVARIEAIRLFLAYASFMGFIVYQMDVKSAFLYGTIKEEVYVCQPLGFEDPDYPDKVYKVVKALYGLHQAPRAWYETLANYLLENGFQRGKIDQTLFIKRQNGDILLVQIYVNDIIFDGKSASTPIDTKKPLLKDLNVARIEAIRLFLAYASFMGFIVYQMDVKSTFLYGTIEKEVYVCQPPRFEDPDHPDKIYVDEIIFGSTNKNLCKSFEKFMKDWFQMSSMGELTFFLGLQVKKKKDGIFISQDKYVVEILRKFRLTEGKSASTPIDTEKPLLMDPDVKRIFRYLKGKPYLSLWYPKDSPFDLMAYSDSDYAGVNTPRCDEDRLELIELMVFLLPSDEKVRVEFWTTIAVKKVNDVTSFQALVERRKGEEEAKDIAVDAKDGQDADVQVNADIQRRTAESQAEIYKIDLDHANKIITAVVTAASTTITAADVPIPDVTTAAALTLTAAPKQIDEEESRALKRINETPAEIAAKRKKLDEEVEELKRHLQIVPNDDDDVYTEATLLVRKVPVLTTKSKEPTVVVRRQRRNGVSVVVVGRLTWWWQRWWYKWWGWCSVVSVLVMWCCCRPRMGANGVVAAAAVTAVVVVSASERE
nr:putative ribonuclease H-like domain-containing protein [Tanacetum cinerariifolium]